MGTPKIEQHRILAQQARFPNDIGERAFLHELGLNEECCSFNKGCYVGQEIINRMDVKGLVNKSSTCIKAKLHLLLVKMSRWKRRKSEWFVQLVK